jgi:hypothetical protein
LIVSTRVADSALHAMVTDSTNSVGRRLCQQYSVVTGNFHENSYLEELLETYILSQALSRQFSTTTAFVRSQFSSCGIYGGQSGTDVGFLRVLRFPLPILIPPTAPSSYHRRHIVSIFTTPLKSTQLSEGPIYFV